MVLRIVYKRGVLPMSIRSFILNAIAFLGVSCILALGLRILAPFEGIRPTPFRPNLIADRSFVVLSVDDFGRWTDSVPLFPSSSFMNNHSSLIIQNNYWYRRATVETRHDLTHLHSALTALNKDVPFDQRAVLTPHWIVGGPDFGAMRTAGCGVSNRPPGISPLPHNLRQSTVPENSSDVDQHPTPQGDFDNCAYKEQLLSDAGPTGLDQPPYFRGDLRESYRQLWTSGLWHPEYHGRSHFSVNKWLRLLKMDDKTQACFKNNLVCATDTTQLRSEFNGFSSKADLKTWLEEGVNAFAAFWGYRPALISSPHNTWSSWLTDVAVDLSFIGAELAEDQANYVEHENELSLHDRFRFDVFFPGFDCDRAIEEVEELLRVPVEKSMSDRWYEFLSIIDLFRVHHRPYHHGSGGEHERFISLMWHAQNAMSSTYSDNEHAGHMQCLDKVVRKVRESTPRAVFVTGSELHQIRSKGWSREIWSDSIILRNYGTHAVDLQVTDLRDSYSKSRSWRGETVYATTLSSARSGNSERLKSTVGAWIHLEPDTVVRLSVA